MGAGRSQELEGSQERGGGRRVQEVEPDDVVHPQRLQLYSSESTTYANDRGRYLHCIRGSCCTSNAARISAVMQCSGCSGNWQAAQSNQDSSNAFVVTQSALLIHSKIRRPSFELEFTTSAPRGRGAGQVRWWGGTCSTTLARLQRLISGTVSAARPSKAASV